MHHPSLWPPSSSRYQLKYRMGVNEPTQPWPPPSRRGRLRQRATCHLIFLCSQKPRCPFFQSGRNSSKYPRQSLHYLITHSAGREKALWLWPFFHQVRITSASAPLPRARAWGGRKTKTCLMLRESSEFCLVHTHTCFVVLMELLFFWDSCGREVLIHSTVILDCGVVILGVVLYSTGVTPLHKQHQLSKGCVFTVVVCPAILDISGYLEKLIYSRSLAQIYFEVCPCISVHSICVGAQLLNTIDWRILLYTPVYYTSVRINGACLQR